MSAITVIIGTLDEEIHIGRAVACSRDLGPVFVVNSGSTDGTREVAAQAGATVVEHAWEGYAGQKNWARENLPIETAWILHLDADEYLTPALRREMLARIGSEDAVGYYVARENVFLGRVLRRAWWYPDYQLRLFRRDRGRYEDRLVHEHVLLDGAVGFLDHPLIHENLKGIDEFMARHVKYAELEVAELYGPAGAGRREQRSGSLVGSWPERRRALKRTVWYRLPARPAIRFLWLYVLRRGFLDGREGLVYCQLIAAYEAIIDAKLAEAKAERLEMTSAGVDTGALADRLACPSCHGTLDGVNAKLSCTGCGTSYPVDDGIPLFASDGVATGVSVSRDSSVRLPYDPTLIGFEGALPGATAVASGRDAVAHAETLARAGSSVLAVVPGIDAARAGAERARERAWPITYVVGSASRLPLRDDSVALGYWRDDRNPLAHALDEVAELVRVSSRVALSGRSSPLTSRALRPVHDMVERQSFDVVNSRRYAPRLRSTSTAPLQAFGSGVTIRAVRKSGD